MEPRVFNEDATILHTDVCDDAGIGGYVNPGILAVEGGQAEIDSRRDRVTVMEKINAIVHASYADRDLEIVQARLEGAMTRDRFDALVERHKITVERIRQTQRGALPHVRQALVGDGIDEMAAVSCDA